MAQCAGHRQRVKDKYRLAGLEGWHDYEILELLLFYAIPRKDTKPAAKRLIERFGSFSSVLDATPQELRTVKGISEHTALFIKIVKDAAKSYAKGRMDGKDIVQSPEAAVAYLKAALKGAPDEEFHALFLNAGNRVLSTEVIQTGTVTRSAVFPRKIVERALHHRATGIIIAHNHPGGVLRPSEDDKRATAAIANALSTVEVSLLDHIIITSAGYFSWKEHHLL